MSARTSKKGTIGHRLNNNNLSTTKNLQRILFWQQSNAYSKPGLPRDLEPVALIECKNWKKELSYTDLINIMEKSFSHSNCKIHFVFCRKLKDRFAAKTKESYFKFLEKFCYKNCIYAYSFQRTEANSFKVIPFAGTNNPSPPEMISFIYELNVFNDEE